MTKKIIITEELKKILNQINNPLSHLILNENISDDNIVDLDKYINYIDISQSNKGHLSYLTKDRISKIENSEDKDYWKAKMRYHGRPGSVLKKLFHPNLSRHFEDFSMKYISIADKPEYHMELVNGNDIAKYYDYKNYYNQNGNLGGSCMSRVPSDFFDFYVQNVRNINLLVMLDQHDKIMGRAIIWIGNDFKLMDRIYTCNDLYESYFEDWAKSNNVMHKEYNNYKTPMHIIDPTNNTNIIKKYVINLEQSSFNKYPYLDSFKWLNRKTNKIYNYIPENQEDLIVLCDSMGGHLNKDTYDFDDITNEMYCKNDIIYIEYMNKKVYIGNTFKSCVYDTYIYQKHSIYSDEIKDYIFNKEYDNHNDYEKIKNKIIEKEKRIKNAIDKLSELKSSDGWDLGKDTIDPYTEQAPPMFDSIPAEQRIYVRRCYGYDYNISNDINEIDFVDDLPNAPNNSN